jgi:hypothetical protein
MPSQGFRREVSQYRTAESILAGATEVTPTVLWAAGVFLMQHCLWASRIWSGEHPFDHEQRGGTVRLPDGHARFLDVFGGTVTLRESGGRADVLSFTTRKLEKLIGKDTVPEALRVRVADALRTRKEVSGEKQAQSAAWVLGPAPTPDQVEQVGAQWAAAERACVDLAVEVWEHVRPRQKPEQLSLFEAA